MNLFKKIVLMLLGLFVMAVAMALLSAVDMGISPVQSLAYVISQKIPDYRGGKPHPLPEDVRVFPERKKQWAYMQETEKAA